MKRKATISRKTKETSITVSANIDGKGEYKIKTGIGLNAKINNFGEGRIELFLTAHSKIIKKN